MATDERSKFFKALGETDFQATKKEGALSRSLAAKIGIDRVAVGYIEQGGRKPSLSTVYNMLATLGCPWRVSLKGSEERHSVELNVGKA